jgi:pimeloyl-ACP methyl ester carboxylesterase
MQREAFELPEWDDEQAPEHELTPPAAGRLGAIACPTLVVVGDADQPAVLETADRLVAEVPDVRRVVFPDTAHMLSLERPDAFADLVERFLGEVAGRRS